jgi:hypothetical protein
VCVCENECCPCRNIFAAIVGSIIVAIDTTDECKAAVAALLPTLGDVQMSCLPEFAVNKAMSSGGFEGQEMKRSYLVSQSASMTKLTKATNATTTIAKTRQRRWHHQHAIKSDGDGFYANLRNFVPQSPPVIDLLKLNDGRIFVRQHL